MELKKFKLGGFLRRGEQICRVTDSTQGLYLLPYTKRVPLDLKYNFRQALIFTTFPYCASVLSVTGNPLIQRRFRGVQQGGLDSN